MSNALWAKIRREYLGGATYQELGDKYGIAPSTIGRRRHKEGWGGRDDGSVMLRRCAAMVERLSEAVEETLENHTEPWAIKELKDLSALMREVIGLHKLVSQAPEDSDDELDGQLRIVLEGPLEDWGG